MDLLEKTESETRADPIDIILTRATQLRALLAVTTISHQSGDLLAVHMGNVLSLAAELTLGILDAVEQLI